MLIQLDLFEDLLLKKFHFFIVFVMFLFGISQSISLLLTELLIFSILGCCFIVQFMQFYFSWQLDQIRQFIEFSQLIKGLFLWNQVVDDSSQYNILNLDFIISLLYKFIGFSHFQIQNIMDPKYSALFTSVNLLLGVGPLILPHSYFEGGIVLSTIWMLFIMIISYNSAMYIVQAMTKVSHIDSQSQDSLQRSLISNQNQISQAQFQRSRLNNQTTEQSTNNQTQQKKYDHIEQFGVLYGQKYKIIPSLIISIYLTGTAISKCIMTGNILSIVFQDVQILDRYQFWLGLFFLSGAAFSFKSIQSTKALQFFIIIARFISIVAMIGGAIFIMIKYGVQTPVPQDQGVFNINNFAQIFSNSLFALMFHHSLPGIARQVKNTTDTSFFIKTAFLISGSTLLIIPLTASLAFGNELGQHKYKYYNFDFKAYDQTIFVYYIVSFYVFLNIAAFSVYTIVIRTNVLKVFFPEVDPMKVSKKTISLTIVLLTIICIVGLTLQEYIQYVLDFTGGVFGSIILFFLPCLEVYSSRKRVYRNGDRKNYLQRLPIVIMVLGGIFMLFNLFQVIKKLAKF